MEQLSNELFKGLQGDAETSVYCAKKAKPAPPSLFDGSMRLCLHLLSGTHPRQLAQTEKLRLSLRVRRQQSERKDYRLFAINGEDRVSRNSCGITNLTVRLHCSGHHNLNVSIHLFMSLVSVATNYSCFVSTIMCFHQHFFLMYP